MKRLVVALAALAMPVVASADDTFTLSVTALLSGTCTVTETTGTLDFGTITASPITPALDMMSSSFSLSCTGISANITSDLGLNESGTQSRMTDGLGNYLAYDLYADAAFARLIGTSSVAWAASGTTVIYGRIPNGTTWTTNGLYSDTVTISVTP